MLIRTSIIGKILVAIIYCAILLMGSFMVGPVSLRNITTVLILVLLFLNGKVKIPKGAPRVYLFYLFIMILLALLNGDVSSGWFFRQLVGFHICSLLIFLFGVMNGRKFLNVVLYTLIFIYVCDGIITILQYYGNSIAWVFSHLFYNTSTEELSVDVANSIERNLSGVSMVPGILGNVVNNAYFLAVFLPVVTSSLWKNKFNVSSLFSVSIFVIGAFAIYTTQQRMAALCLILYFVCLLVRFYLTSRNKVFSVFLIFIMIYYIASFILNVDLGRLTLETDNSDRTSLFNDFVLFSRDGNNIVFGGKDNYLNHYGGVQHNTFLDVLTRGGIVLLSVFLVLFFKVLFLCFSNIKKYFRKLSYGTPFAISCVLYLGYSMTHSSGLQSGDVMIWIPLSLLYAVMENEKSEWIY